VMYRAVSGSASMAVFCTMSDARQVRRINRSVSITGPLMCANATPGLTLIFIVTFASFFSLSPTLIPAMIIANFEHRPKPR
jgi:hypothetical protein